MYIYAIFYLLIGAALFVALFINYTDLLDTDESYVEIGCGEEYNLVIFVIVGIFWPLFFILSIIMLLLNLIKYVYNMCNKRFTR